MENNNSTVQDNEVVQDRVQNETQKEKKKSKKKKVFITILVILILIPIAIFTYRYYKDNDRKEDTDKIETDTKEVYSPYRITDNGLTAFDLYFLQLENEAKNKLYSPLSIKYALEMLAEGTKGASQSQIKSIVGEYQPRKYMDSANMSFANAMFIKDTYKDKMKKDYVNTLISKYNAEVVYDPFQNANNLNTWVSNKTFGLIESLFDNSVSGQDYILTNALAIDMEWKYLIQNAAGSKVDGKYLHVTYPHEKFEMGVAIIEDEKYSSVPFNNAINAKAVEIGAAINNYDIVNTLGEENIRKTVGDFYQAWLNEDEYNYISARENGELDTNVYLDKYIAQLNSNYKRVDTSTDFSFYVDDDVKVFAKDLKEYDNLALQYVGIMPKNNSLEEYIKNVDAKGINQIINNLKTIEPDNFEQGAVTKITGYIPLFQFDYELNLVKDLKKLGITDVFQKEKADLSNMTSSKNAYINDATHKANIEFSNEGIKASAVTTLGGLGAASGGFDYLYDVPVITIDLTFDKPYMFLIRDKNTGEVWFTGTVYEPIENQ